MIPAKTAAANFFSRPIVQIGGTALTLEAILKALFILALAMTAAWGVRKLVRRAQDHLGEERAPAIYIGGQIIRYIVFFAGIAVAVSSLGVDLSALSLFAGALGVGIGIGLQDVVKNFVSGIVLLFDRGIEVGDFIELDVDTRGAVIAIGPRATTLLTNDNVHVLVPNAVLLGAKLTNWTRNRGTRRIHIPFSVAFGTDKERVKQAGLEAARSVPFTLPDEGRQRTQVWLVGFGESALKFELVVWPSLEAVKRPGNMLAAYCWALDDKLREYGIELPFPQRDIRVRSFFGHEGDEAMTAWQGGEGAGGESRGPASARGALGASDNDAARDIDEADEGK